MSGNYSSFSQFVLVPTVPHRQYIQLEGSVALGANVSAHYNTNADPLGTLISEYGPERIQRVQANLTVGHGVQQIFAAPKFGAVQVVIVNHGWHPTENVPLYK